MRRKVIRWTRQTQATHTPPTSGPTLARSMRSSATRPNTGSTIRPSSTIRAAWASSPISRATRDHQIIVDADTVLRNMTTAAPAAASRTRATAPASSPPCRTSSSRKVAQADLGAELPEPGRYAAGVVFLPRIDSEREFCKAAVERIVAEQGQRLIGWRRVPTDAKKANIGPSAAATEPVIEQLSSPRETVGRFPIRPTCGHRRRDLADASSGSSISFASGPAICFAATRALKQRQMFYVCSLSTKVIIYKGSSRPSRSCRTFPTWPTRDYTSHLAMVHSRFTHEHVPLVGPGPADAVHVPQRRDQHAPRQHQLDGRPRRACSKSELFGDDLQKLFPITEPD